MRRLLIGVLIAGLSACAVSPPPMSDDPASGARTASRSGDVVVPPPSAGSALARQGRQFLARGDHAQASVAIERALRIEPGNASLWVDLGAVRLAEGNTSQAIALAQKALRIAEDDTTREAAERLLREANGH